MNRLPSPAVICAVLYVHVLPTQPTGATEAVPLAQVTDDVLMRWENPPIRRRDRRRTITVQANPVLGATFPSLRSAVVEQIEALEMPPGFRLEWGGEYESSSRGQKSLLPGGIPAAVIVAFIVVALFNAPRPPLFIAATIPFVIIGITAGLLGTGAAFGFVALLGAMSLKGMMIKNAIVLLDEVNLNYDGAWVDTRRWKKRQFRACAPWCSRPQPPCSA